ncbi:MAG TPA: RsmE family RNA methyltransferase [Gemmatimonadales bacterium]|nr:RsmE family RNA methyltransferase [Gemmatimonadales bacterium]
MSLRGLAPPAATVVARGPFLAGGVVILDEAEAHHLAVRRVGDGALIRLVDGRGGVATARVSEENQVIVARVIATASIGAPPVTELLLGAGDRDRFLSAVEKATELGATRIVPVVSERAAGVATRFQAAHVERATARAREAVKQCGVSWAPAIGAPVALGEALRPHPAGVVRLVADLEGGPMPGLREGDAVQWLIGPEGGFSDAELMLVRSAGFRPVALGRATLRFDTAAAAALVVTWMMRGRGEA